MTDPLIETDPKTVLAKVEGADLATWSDERRADFCNVFQKRVQVANYLLVTTAEHIMHTAKRRQFISEKHNREIFKGLVAPSSHQDRDYIRVFHARLQFDKSEKDLRVEYKSIGGRDLDSLNVIAGKRAKDILSNLPPLAKAVEVIDPETARRIDRKDALLKQGEELRVRLDTVCGVIDMDDVDQKMTVGDFTKMVRARNAERKKIIRKMNDIAQEGMKLEEQIAKKLYAGLPGLSEAVVNVIRAHLEQSIALDETSRRVEEQVKFGESAAAVEMLRHFEKDEIQISESVKGQFAAALEKLKLSVRNRPKSKSKAQKELRA